MPFAEMAIKEGGKLVWNLVMGWKHFAENEVVVGITEETASRGGPINNAELLYLHSNGVPSHNIPARPVLEPALAEDDVREQIQDLMKSAAESALVFGDTEACDAKWEKAGMVARDACKKRILSGIPPPNAPSTMARKMAKAKKKPSKVAEENGAGGAIPLIDTGAMMNAITYAVRRKK